MDAVAGPAATFNGANHLDEKNLNASFYGRSSQGIRQGFAEYITLGRSPWSN
jgi:hypothetical protein